jgi:GntR family transcriptional repressor for pyruvate dehydrogenase complex
MQDQNLFRYVGIKGGLVDRVVGEIQRVIVDGQLEPGMKLPPERELAYELGVSRTVIREAVRILVAKGLLETRPGVGTLVRQVGRDQIVEPLSLLLQSQEGGISLDHLHQVRQILEVEIAGLAAVQATEEDIARLKQIVNRMEAAAGVPESFAALDGDFHQALARTTRNPLLVLLLDSIRDVMQAVRLRVNRHPGLYERVMRDHTQIVERVAAKDARGARQAMREHLEHARDIQHAVLQHEDDPLPTGMPAIDRS